MEKVQYSGPKFITLFSQHFGHAYDVISLNSMNDVTKNDRSSHFQDKALFSLFFIGGYRPQTPAVLRKYYYTSVLEHILAKKRNIYIFIS